MNVKANALAIFGLCAALGLAGCDQSAKQAQEHRKKGNELYKQEQWQAAAAEFDLSLQADPKQEKLWMKKAVAHAKARQMDLATDSMLKTLEFKTEPAQKGEVYRNIGNMFLQQGPAENAEKYFLEALKIDPKDEAALSWLGEMFSQLGGARAMAAPAVPAHLDKAVSYYDQAIAVNPSSPNAYLNKRIALTKYLEHLRLEKEAADQEALESKDDKEKAAAAQARSQELATQYEQLKVKFDENNTKLGEVSKAARAGTK